jgi:hypothetical protein
MSHFLTELTEVEIQRGKLLSPDTEKLLRYEISVKEELLLNVTFHADPVLRETAILQYVEAQAKRNALLELLQGAAEIRASLQELQSQ